MTTLTFALHTWQMWKQEALTPHLTPADIYRLSRPRGLYGASEADLDHLASCPDCLAGWELLCVLDEPSDPPETAADIISFGRLKAAATKASAPGKAPVYLESGCGRFKLGIFPEPGRPGRGMVTLDVIGSDHKIKDRLATVKDTAGQIILRGKIIHGRTAGRIDGIDTLDLSLWTVTLT
ncbi:MAG TPA: hypothetical protein DHV36_24680 [Desulfobacteraceae bacterium]|nr:hypothetical protein [Desulfobacteraceae bacterium]